MTNAIERTKVFNHYNGDMAAVTLRVDLYIPFAIVC